MNQQTPEIEPILRVSNTPREFAWGKIDGMAERLGLPTSGRPQAELWLGAHPVLPAEIVDHQVPWKNLCEWEYAHDYTLPFMLKVLAVGRVLSIQAHPGKTRAEAGYARENAQGIPRDDPGRNYRDPYPKPELIVALDDHFTALCGFRNRQHTFALLNALQEISASAVEFPWERFRKLLSRDSARDVVEWVLSDGEVQQQLYALVRDAVRAGSCGKKTELWVADAISTLAQIDQQFPGDASLLFAVLLKQHHLARGEALWLPTGTPHAYVSGYGVEIMGPSDNVFRGGLTEKHIDRNALIDALNFDDDFQHRISGTVQRGAHIFEPSFSAQDGPGFTLLRCEGDAELELASPSCVLVTDGEFALNFESGSAALKKGQSALIAGGALSVRGTGQVFFATGSSAPHVAGSN